mgnify:CR=1 FL=1
MSKCRSCGAKILWTVTCKGKNMPIDFDEDLTEEFKHASFYKTTVDFDISRMRSHFYTCPNAEQHRKLGGEYARSNAYDGY